VSIGLQAILSLVGATDTLQFGKLSPHLFEGELEKEVYAYIKEHTIKYSKFPASNTLFSKYPMLSNIEITEPIQYYLDLLHERFVFNTTNEIVPKVNEHLNKRDSKTVLSLLKGLVDKCERVKIETSKDISTLVEGKDLVLNAVRINRAFGIVTGITTGWPTLDIATGGYQNGDIFVVLARVKIGKTLCLLYSALKAYQAGHSVMIISMEMPEIQMWQRWIALQAGINMTMLQRGKISSFTDEIIKGLPIRENKIYLVSGQFKKTISDVIGIVNYYAPNILFIDGGYLIKPDKSFKKPKWEMMSEVIEDLKTLSITTNIPIVISFQFNRTVSRKSKTLEDEGFDKIQLSDAISQIASTGIGILNDPMSLDNRKIIEIIGGRSGEKGTFSINWDWERMNFEEIDPPQIEAYEENDI